MASRATMMKRLKRRGSAIVHLREVALVVAAYFAYIVVRKVAFIGGEEAAFRNALKIISFEQSIGLFWEPVAQEDCCVDCGVLPIASETGEIPVQDGVEGWRTTPSQGYHRLKRGAVSRASAVCFFHELSDKLKAVAKGIFP